MPREAKGKELGVKPTPCSSVALGFIWETGHEETTITRKAEQIRVRVLTRDTQEGFSEEVTTKTWRLRAVRVRG